MIPLPCKHAQFKLKHGGVCHVFEFSQKRANLMLKRNVLLGQCHSWVVAHDAKRVLQLELTPNSRGEFEIVLKTVL